MKFYHISLLLFFVFASAGCIDENLDSCPEITKNNLILEFVHTNDTGADIFSGNIHRADVFVFDVNGYFVQHQRVEKEALSVFAGTKLSLAAGTYRIVCWGNAYDKTSLSDLPVGSLFSDAFVGFGIPDANNIARGGDPLYYAPRTISPSQPFIVTVPEQGVETATVDFCSAHIKVEIYIKGFENKIPLGEPELPLVELTDLPAGYDFDMQTSGSLISFVSYREVATTRTVEGQQLAVISFYTPLFEENTSTKVLTKKQSDHGIVTTINLEDFIRDNHITLTGATEVVIPIYVNYEDGGIKISLPDWGVTPITPR